MIKKISNKKFHYLTNKKILLILFLLFVPNLVSAVEIYQIYYDPANSESGGEAIEFYNPHPFDIALDGWTVATESSLKDAVFPASSTIPAEGYFLLADNMWDERKDDSNWRNADFMTPITLNNVDSGVALINSTGSVIDAVGWGNPANIDNNLYTGTPTNDAPQSKVLLRIDSTDDNSNDFIVADPNFFDNNIIEVEVNVSNSVESSAYILEGGSITPNAGANTTIHVRAGELMSATFHDITKTMTKIDNNTYETRFSIPYYQSPGNYSIYFSDNTELNFEIKELRSFKVKASKISFNVIPGTSSIASNKALITNNGNTNLIFSLDTVGTLSDFSFQYKLADDFIDFTETFELEAGKSSNLEFKIEIPEETELGSYQSLITITPE